MLGYYGISLAGGTECRDAYAVTRTEKGWIIAATAGGLGNAGYAGAKIAVTETLRFVEENLLENWDGDTLKAMLRLAFNAAFKAVKKTAKEQGQNMEEYDTSLTAVIYNGMNAVYGQVGEGGIVALSGSGDFSVLAGIQKSEENTVVSLRMGEGYWRFGSSSESSCALLLMTGGVFAVACPEQFAEKNPPVYLKFVRPFMDTNLLLVKTEQDFDDAKSEIEAFFNGSEANYIYGDKTVVGIINTDETPMVKSDSYYEEPEFVGMKEGQSAGSVYTGSSGKTYEIAGEPFASGGEGDIYEIPGNAELVLKIYKPEKRTTETERKLSVMVNNKPDVIEQYAWPIDVLYEDGKFAGFVMPRIHGKEKLRNIYVYDKRDKRWKLYLAIAKNLAAAVYNVHEIGQVIGDLNPENILVDRQTGLVTLVDTDSYHITDGSGDVYRCGVGMPEFVAPELQGIHFPSEPLPTFTKETDAFALSVLMFALLMNGAHPFACKTMSGSSSKFQPIDNMSSGTCAYFAESSRTDIEIPRYAPPLTMLPLEIQSLFQRSFVEGHKMPSMRPTAEEWYKALERLEQNITACSGNPEHQYYKFAPDCPWCAVEVKMAGIASPNPQPVEVSASPEQEYTPYSTPPPKPEETGWSTTAKVIFWVTVIIVIIGIIMTGLPGIF